MWCWHHKIFIFGADTIKLKKPGNHPKERIQHSVYSESLKSRILRLCALFTWICVGLWMAQFVYCLGYGWTADGLAFRFPIGARVSSVVHTWGPVWLCDWPSLLSGGARCSFPVVKAAGLWRWPFACILRRDYLQLSHSFIFFRLYFYQCIYGCILVLIL